MAVETLESREDERGSLRALMREEDAFDVLEAESATFLTMVLTAAPGLVMVLTAVEI